ncbi:MAG: peptide ABC transporter substrate-binding protein [Chloroflexi bacterium]|nr:peptide ABC transporter substrate-binding protein [Chloroflexota bacterium]
MKQKALYILVLAALILSACGGLAGGGGQPSVVRIGWASGPDSLNIGVAWLASAYTISELTYSSMYEFKLDGTLGLDLGTKETASADGLVYTYKIRDGVKFHDGQPLTAKDVAFTYNLVMAHEDFPTLHSYVEHFVSVEAPDASTVVITLDQPIPNIASKLVFLYILPEHIWKDHSEDDAAAAYENLEMIGSGPFKMLEYKPNEFIRLGVNKDYYGAVPKVDEVIFQVFSSSDVLIQALKTGQVDMITSVPNTSVETLKSAENVKVVTGAPLSPDLEDIIFNMVDPANCPTADGGLCTGHPALRDKQVRLAMAYATDKNKIIEIVKLGLATPGIALIPSGMGEWFNIEVKDFEYDPAKGNQLLDEAGYKDANGDGIRDMPDGSRPLTFRMNWPSSDNEAPRIAELLSEMWRELGITLEMQAVESDALTSKCCPALDYDLMIWGWVADPDPNSLLIVPTTDQIPTGYNETGYSNPRYDELFAAQGAELDKDKRIKMAWEMQQLVHDDVAYIIPYYPYAVQAYRTDRFTGWLDTETKLALEDPSSLTIIEPVK